MLDFELEELEVDLLDLEDEELEADELLELDEELASELAAELSLLDDEEVAMPWASFQALRTSLKV